MRELLRQAHHRQDGIYAVMVLMLIAWVCVPLTLVVVDAGRGGSAASQATGMSYNLAYTAASRAVDPEATGEAGVAQLSYKDGEVEADAQTVLDYQGQLASLSTRGASEFTLTDSSEGLNSGNPPAVSDPPQLALVNVGVENWEASVANSTKYGAGSACGGGIAGGNFATAVTTVGESVVCWTDQRTAGRVSRGIYEHFSTGAQVRVAFSAPSIFGPAFDTVSEDPSRITGVRTGVAVLARPCKAGASAEDCRL